MIVRLILSALLGASPLVKAAPPKAPRAEPPPAPTAPIDRMPLCFDAAVRSMLLEEHATFQTREHVEAGYAAARWHGVDPSLLLAVGYVESRLRPLHGDSGRPAARGSFTFASGPPSCAGKCRGLMRVASSWLDRSWPRTLRRRTLPESKRATDASVITIRDTPAYRAKRTQHGS